MHIGMYIKLCIKMYMYTCNRNERGKCHSNDRCEEGECSDFRWKSLRGVGCGIAQHGRADGSHNKQQHGLYWRDSVATCTLVFIIMKAQWYCG